MMFGSLTTTQNFFGFNVNIVLNTISVIVPVITAIIIKLIDYWIKKGIRKSHRETWINQLNINEKIKGIILSWRRIEKPFEEKKTLFLSSYAILWISYSVLLSISLTGIFGFFLALAMAFDVTLFVFFILNKLLESSLNLVDSFPEFNDFFEELQKRTDRNLNMRYLIYGILILGITFSAALLEVFTEQFVGKTIWGFLIRYWGMVIYLSVLFSFSILSIVWSHRLEKRYIEVIRGFLHRKCFQEYPIITVYLKSGSEKITGKIMDIFDKDVIKIEDKAGGKFLIPWDLIGLIKVESDKSR